MQLKVNGKSLVSKGHVMFSTNGDGKWRRIEWPAQCPERIIMGGQCQCAKGHAGPHWCYGEDGSFHQAFPKPKGGGSMTPPGHENYIQPEKMQKKCYRNNPKRTRVTDPKEIKRLNAGKIRNGECLNQPVKNPSEALLKLAEQARKECTAKSK